MPANVIRTWTPLHVRLWRAARITYLRWRIKDARQGIEYLRSDPWHDPQLIAVHERVIGAWEVEILVLENGS